jgi:hopanoid-associated phosphorylase
MQAATQFPVLAVTGMAFEARIAAGPGVVAICSGRADILAADIAATVAKGCRGIVSFGIAGGLAHHLEPGTCIVGRSVVTAQQSFDSHLEWASYLLQTIPGAIHADVAGVHAPVVTPAEKAALGHATGAFVVDMESHICADIAAAHGLPFTAVRVVADPSHRALPPAAQIALRPDGRPDMPAVLRSVLNRPHQISALVRVGLDTRAARAALVRARRLLGPGFGLIEREPVLAPQTTVAAAD